MKDIGQVIMKTLKSSPIPLDVFYDTDSICLYHGDCLAVMQTLPDSFVDMIFADPPYHLSNDGITCQAGKMVKVNKGKWDKSNGFEQDVEFHERWISECRRILKPSGTIWISGTNHNIFQCGYLLQKLGFHILNDITWYKPNAAPNLACKTFAHSHETLIWAVKDKRSKYIFNYDAMKSTNDQSDKFKNAGKQMRTVWGINSAPKSEKIFGKHPTQKPLTLLIRVITASTNAGSVILDPFNGGGTTGAAASIIGQRKYIGIDIDKEFLELTISRIEQAQSQRKLIG